MAIAAAAAGEQSDRQSQGEEPATQPSCPTGLRECHCKRPKPERLSELPYDRESAGYRLPGSSPGHRA